MLVLGIESSCDETAAAVAADGRTLLAHVVRSQVAAHRPYGGIVPEIAARAHVALLVPVIEAAVREAGLDWADLDAVAVTHRPGLIGALLVGVAAAKALAAARELPLVGVCHLEGHLEAWRLEHPDWRYPYLGLAVSGGHSHLFACEGPTAHRCLGGTVDDAAGEAFDKVAALLGLEYPGGPALERAAQGGDPARFPFKRAFWKRPELALSFSGLKTAVRYLVQGQNAGARAARGKQEPGASATGQSDPSLTLRAPVSEEPRDQRFLADVAASFQEAVVETLLDRARTALVQTGLPRLFVTGGVAANTRLRERFTAAGQEWGIDVRFPARRFCTDNAAMIAAFGHELLVQGQVADLDLAAYPARRVCS